MGRLKGCDFMDKKIYSRGIVGQTWYNFTECLAYGLLYRPIPDGITYTKKLSYAKGKNNYMNVFSRTDLKDKKKPIFIYIHGGGWISGITDMRNQYVTNWVKLGFHAFSINYSYAPQAVFPTQLQDVFTAIDYIFDNADKYNLDTDNVVISGESAGGYFISYVSSCINNWERLDKIGVAFKNKDKFKVKAVVAHSGCYDVNRLTDKTKEQSRFPDMKMMVTSFIGKPLDELHEYSKTPDGKYLSPMLTEYFPPTYLVWCTRDKLRFETFDMAEELKALSVPHKLYKADGSIGNHAWSIAMVFAKSKLCFKDTIDFVLPYLPDCFEKVNSEWQMK